MQPTRAEYHEWFQCDPTIGLVTISNAQGIAATFSLNRVGLNNQIVDERATIAVSITFNLEALGSVLTPEEFAGSSFFIIAI